MKRILSLAVIIVMMVSLLGVFSVSAQEDSEVMRVNASLNKDLCGCGFINVPLSTGAKVSSVEALGDHICNYNLINLQHNFDRNKYDKSFFEEKFLFFFTMYESKSGNKYELTSLTELKDAVIVEITKVKQGNLTVEEFWLLALEIDRELAGKRIIIVKNGLIAWNEPGSIAVTGKVKTYDPYNPTTVRLMQSDTVKYETTIPAVTESGQSGQKEQSFNFENVNPGAYSLVITKPIHTKFTVQNVVVGNEAVDLTRDSRDEVRLMTLRCGDINGDGLINDADLTTLWLATNYNKSVKDGANPLCDINGDGLVNDADLTILWLQYDYNRGEIIIP